MAMNQSPGMPFEPFGFDTRTLIPSQNPNPNMEYLSTLLASKNMDRHNIWLIHTTYLQLYYFIEEYFMSMDSSSESENENETSQQTKEVGEVTKFIEIVHQMKERGEKLDEYCRYFENNGKNVDEIDAILKYLLQISNYPMEPATDHHISVAGYICQVLEHVLSVLDKCPETRVGYFLTMCAVIFDVICRLNYLPFRAKYYKLKEMCDELRRIARDTGNLEHILGRGFDEEERQRDKKERYQLVKFFYIAPKDSQGPIMKRMKNKAKEMLEEFKSLHDSPVPSSTGEFHAVRGHQVGAGSSTVVKK